MVPGNHDIDRQMATEVWQQMRRGIWSQPQAVNEWLAGTAQSPFGFAVVWPDALFGCQQACWDSVHHALGRSELLPKNSPHGRLGYRVCVDMPECTTPVHVIGLDQPG